MTQKQLQGDWEKKPNSGTSLKHFISRSRDPLGKVLRHPPHFDPKLPKQLDSDINPQMKLSSLVNWAGAAGFPAFRPLTRWHFDPSPTTMTQTFASNVRPDRNDKYCERCGVACGITASCRGRVNRCLEVATADKAANLVMHISGRCAVSPYTNVAYRYANTFP